MFRRQGDRAIVVTFDGPVADANAQARAAAEAVAAAPGVAGVVPAARTLLVHLGSGADPDAIAALARSAPAGRAGAAARDHSIPVSYDGEDLGEVARETGLAAADIVALHTGARYTVAFLGFMPGFPYLLGLPPPLRLSRLATPRTAVPAGSVAIAGEWAGIYPSSSPGGWRILGHTHVALFDPHAAQPSLLQPGDHVRFVES